MTSLGARLHHKLLRSYVAWSLDAAELEVCTCVDLLLTMPGECAERGVQVVCHASGA